jgi:hypothetical protein
MIDARARKEIESRGYPEGGVSNRQPLSINYYFVKDYTVRFLLVVHYCGRERRFP